MSWADLGELKGRSASEVMMNDAALESLTMRCAL